MPKDTKWSSPKTEEEALQLWTQYKEEYKKQYDEEEEDKRRKGYFLDNLKRFEEHNKKYEQGLTTYTIGVNQFADLGPGEKACCH